MKLKSRVPVTVSILRYSIERNVYLLDFRTMEGGAKSGFRHVEPEQYQPRLLRFNGQRRTVTIREVSSCKQRQGFWRRSVPF